MYHGQPSLWADLDQFDASSLATIGRVASTLRFGPLAEIAREIASGREPMFAISEPDTVTPRAFWLDLDAEPTVDEIEADMLELARDLYVDEVEVDDQLASRFLAVAEGLTNEAVPTFVRNEGAVRRSKVVLYEQIRTVHAREGESIHELARRFHVHRRSVREALASSVPAVRKVPERPAPVLGPWKATIDAWPEADRSAPRKQRHTARRVWQRLVEEHGVAVAESTVRGYASSRSSKEILEEPREQFWPMRVGR